LPSGVFLPQHFKNHGYHTVGMGKIFYNGPEDPLSWFEPHWLPEDYPNAYCTKAGRALVKQLQDEALAAGKPDPFKHVPEHIRRGRPYEALDVRDNELSDGQIADQAISTLRRVKDQPFFMGVGFLRPHLPFAAPRKYWDMYSPEDIRLARNPFPPKDAPDVALHNSSELRQQYQGVPKSGTIDQELARNLVHGYYACVSYVDAQVGRVLDELERLGLADNTLVVLWGDHGWHLGEHGLWCKHTNFEVATRSTLIMSAPGMKAGGQKTSSLVEFVGIYPTLCDLAGLPQPTTLEGTSFAKLFDDPKREISKVAFSQYPRGKVMGYSMRTDRYRYTEWRATSDGQVQAAELYDHVTDPEENVNQANEPASAKIIKELAAEMRNGLRHTVVGRKAK
jgi:arylsulfatase A-like enzyme